MYNLYQSQLRQDIQTIVYRRPSMTIRLFGKEYFALIKDKKFWPIKSQWIQVMGVELPSDKDYVKQELLRVKKELSKKNTNIMLQLGIINEMISFENVSHRSESFSDDMKHMRINLQKFICKHYKLKVAFRENMPNSNIIIDLSKPDETLLMEMNASARQRIRKAFGKKIEFGMAPPDQYKSFYDKWLETSGNKWFNIIPYEQFETLLRYITQNGRGNLFVATIGWEIVSGNVCLYDEKNIIYLYGFSDRKFWNIWSHHYLKYKMFSRARDNGFLYCDLMGGAPTGFPKHHLTSVSEFKESLGWIKIEQYGSYDVVLNPVLYNLFKLYHKLRK